MNSKTDTANINDSKQINPSLKWGLIGGSGVLAATLTTLLVNKYKKDIKTTLYRNARKGESLATNLMTNIAKL